MDTHSLLLKDKPALALLALQELKPAYAAAVSKRIDSTFPHTLRILSQMEEAGLLRSRPEGRVRLLELTDYGRAVASAVKRLVDLLEQSSLSWSRIHRIEGIVSDAMNADCNPFCLGPLRRDLFILKQDGNPLVRDNAEKLDARIVMYLGEEK